MPELGQYGGFILASYVFAGLVLGFMIGGSVLALRSAKARLGALESEVGKHR
jgi:heme exporter protein CcmD